MIKPPFKSLPDEYPGFLLWKTTLTWQRIQKKCLEPFNVTQPQFILLSLLMWFSNKRVEATQIYLIKMSKLDKMTVSKSLKHLVNLNLVTRSENKDDSRVKTVCLTENGKEMVHILMPVVTNADSEFFGQLNKEDQLHLKPVLGSSSF